MSEKLGKYIVIEGTDGAGTTTQKDLLIENLAERGQKVIGVVEPGGTLIGRALRSIVLDGSLERSPETNLDLFSISRRELALQVIEPQINDGVYVISDRNWFSSVAYQGFGEGLDYQKIFDKSFSALGKFIIPNTTIIIDVPVEVSEERMKHRGIDASDTFEKKGRTFYEKVREGYLWVADEFGLKIVDGTKTIEQVHSEIIELVKIDSTE
ncbi:MAG TPA: dTMP kinase [Candidatus Saccharimonadales bacterium]